MTDTTNTVTYPKFKKVCQLDTQGCYIGRAVADLSPLEAAVGVYLLPEYCIDTSPPAEKPGHAARWTGAEWEYIPDLRGQIVYSTTAGTAVTITEIGALLPATTDTPRPTAYHTWANGKWTLTAAAKSAQLADAKAEKLTALAAAAQRFVSAAAQADVPDFELLIWSTQATEAKAWHEDNSAATPTLDAIAAARGVDVDTLRQKAYAKATAYEQLAANIAGQRQAIEDKIKAATDIAALDAIEIVFSVGDAA